MVVFPDQTDQETPIVTIGDCELLTKKDTKIMRFKKHLWGSEANQPIYDLIRPYMNGDRMLQLGLGYGMSVDTIIDEDYCTEILSYDEQQDIIDVYEDQHDPLDSRLTLICDNIFTASKPNGFWDLILFELQGYTESLYNQCKAYLNWAKTRINGGGYLILQYDRFAEAMAEECFSMLDVSYLAIGSKLGQRFVWIIAQ